MDQYPSDLTTSDWVDFLAGKSRDEQIVILATYHRRIDEAARQHELDNLTHTNRKHHKVVREAADAAKKRLQVRCEAHDYHPEGLPVGRT